MGPPTLVDLILHHKKKGLLNYVTAEEIAFMRILNILKRGISIVQPGLWATEPSPERAF